MVGGRREEWPWTGCTAGISSDIYLVFYTAVRSGTLNVPANVDIRDTSMWHVRDVIIASAPAYCALRKNCATCPANFSPATLFSTLSSVHEVSEFSK